MREPGKLINIANLTTRERGQLAGLLDELSGTNSFKVLENFLGDKFLCFLDIFQGDDLHVPSVQKTLLRAEYIKIYNDSQMYDIDYLAKKYKKNPSVIHNILTEVHTELLQQGGDVNDNEETEQ